MPEKINANTLQGLILRVILANLGGLLALGAVLLKSGAVLEEIAATTKIVDVVKFEQRTMQADITAVRLDVASMKSDVAGNRRDIDNMHRGR